MSAQSSEKQTEVQAVSAELIREREKAQASPGHVAVSTGRMVALWLLAIIVICTTGASLAFALAGLIGIHPFSMPGNLASALTAMWLLWFLSIIATLLLTTKKRRPGARPVTRWRLMRLLSIALLVLGPFVGQLIALISGIAAWFEKDPDERRALRPSALAYLCIAFGWPGMFVTAMHALAPLFESDVQLRGPQGPAALVDLSIANHADPVTSLYLVYGGAGLLYIASIITAVALWRHQRRRAQQARDAFEGSGILEVGETVVRGTVAFAVGGEHALRVEVDQEGTESKSSGSWSHSWTESDRRVLVAPFYLEHATGERIRVEPTQEAHLMDDLDGVIFVDRTKRKRFAELIPGEQVIATGHLSRGHDPEVSGQGYRGGCDGWVLRPPSSGAMLLSTKPLDAPFRHRARNYSIMAITITVLALVGHVLLLPYHQRVVVGEPITAMVTGRHMTTSTNEGTTTHYYHVTVSSQQPPLTLSRAVSQEAQNALVEGSHVPVLYVISRPASSQIGHTPTAHRDIALFLAIAISILSFGFLTWGESTKAWYDEPKVINSGSGHLPTPPKDGGSKDQELDAIS